MSNIDEKQINQQRMSTLPCFVSKENREGVMPVRHHSLALVCHVYYPELFEELVAQCALLENNFDLYVSISKTNLDLIPTIFEHYPNALIYIADNVGRDINPFIVILKVIQPLGYDTLLKLHTKLSPHRSDGEHWRQDMVTKLLGTKENIAQIREKFVQNPKVGLIAPGGHVISYRAYCGASRDRVLKLAKATGLDYSNEHDFPFAAGTMFWANPKALERLTHIPDDELQYEKEPIIEDGALAHAVERFIGLVVESAGFTILDVDGNGNISQPDLNQNYSYTPSSKQLKLRNIHSIILFSPYDERFAIEHVRITAPYAQAGIEIVTGVVNGEISTDLISTVDAVVFQREFPRNLLAYNQIRQIAEEHTIPIIYDLDDLLFKLPDDHPERQSNDYADALMPMMTALVNADLVTVATEKLKETLADFNENIQVVPNYLDDALWKLKAPAVEAQKDQVVTVGYMGSSSHTPDLEMIAPVLSALLDKYGEKLKLHVWGTPLPDSLKGKPGIEWTTSVSNNYAEFAKYFQTQQADLFIAPLKDSLFNRCKSGLKFLEYGALGVPGVFSNLDGYAALITNGQDGFLASSQHDWEQALTRLIDSPELRAEMANNAQATIRDNWLLSQNISTWQDILKSGELSFGNKRQAKMASADLIDAISGQIFWLQRTKEELAQRLKESNSELSEKVQTSVADLEKERQAHQKLEARFKTKLQEIETLSKKADAQALEVKELTEEKSGLFSRIEKAAIENKTLRDRAYQFEQAINVLNQKQEHAAIEKQRLVGLLDEKAIELSNFANRITQQDQAIDQLTRQQAEDASEKLRLAGLVDEKAQQNQALLLTLNAKVIELEAMKNSPSWKLLIFLNKVIRKVLPVDSRFSIWLRGTLLKIAQKGEAIARRISLRRNLALIKRSDLFDREWYLSTYLDVKQAGVDPAVHYILYGGFEGRNPGPNFSSNEYLCKYEDVRQAHLNPLIHYLKFGRAEGRYVSQAYTKELQYEMPDHIMSSRRLLRGINKALKHKDAILSMSHDNYLQNLGGVQIKLADEVKAAALNKVSYLHLYPFFNRSSITLPDEQFFLGVNCDGKEIGVTDRSGITDTFRQLKQVHIKDVRIHHTLGHDLRLIEELIKLTGNSTAEFWLHDFFSICPGYFLLRNDKEYCGAPDVSSNECLICKYGRKRRIQYPEFMDLFKEFKMEVVAPSDFCLQLWRKNFPLKAVSTRVAPHLGLSWIENGPTQTPKENIRIAFVGFPVEHKGWGAWVRLAEKVDRDPRYRFTHFSNVIGKTRNFERISVAVTQKNRLAMVEALRKSEVDVALLWSICPETFSYTLYESLAAGCFIVTNKNSGNIQDFIMRNPDRGLVLEDESELLQLFTGDKLINIINQYQRNGRPCADLVVLKEVEGE